MAGGRRGAAAAHRVAPGQRGIVCRTARRGRCVGRGRCRPYRGQGRPGTRGVQRDLQPLLRPGGRGGSARRRLAGRHERGRVGGQRSAAAEAYTRFAAAYTELEAATPIDATELAYAAIRGMTEFIGNCHTYFLPP